MRPSRRISGSSWNLNAANEKHGRTVYRFFRDELEAKWIQFIPIIERATQETTQIANLGWREQLGIARSE